MTVQSKALIKAFYDQSPRLSYYNGCSTGGRQGLMAAQRYPEDFDAIIAGAPANDHLYLHAGDMARMIDIFKDPEGLHSAGKARRCWRKAVMSACDALDGVKDNLITNPMACKFDPAVLQCKAGDAADCLTAKQVATAKRIYAPAKNSKGELIFPGYAYGGESAYNLMRGFTASPGTDIAQTRLPAICNWDTYRYLAHQDANWDWKTFNIDTDPALAKKNGGIIDAVETDHEQVQGSRRKAPALPRMGRSRDSARAHRRSTTTACSRRWARSQNNWMQLFMVPGMGHCSGGSRAQSDRLDRRSGKLAREGTDAGLDHRQRQERRNADDTTAVPASAGRDLQGQRRHQRRGKFCL